MLCTVITDRSLPPVHRAEQILLTGAQATLNSTISPNKAEHQAAIWGLISPFMTSRLQQENNEVYGAVMEPQ